MSSAARGATALGCLTACLTTLGCAGLPPTGPAKHDLIAVEFHEPRTLVDDTGREIRVACLLGRVVSAFPGRARLRIQAAFGPDGEAVDGLRGLPIALADEDLRGLAVLERERSGEKMALALGTGVAVLVSVSALFLAWALSQAST